MCIRDRDQAALLAVAPAHGVLPWEPDRWTIRPLRAVSGPAHGWDREVLLDGAPVAVVRGHTEIRAAHRLTCSAAAPSRASVPVVDAVEAIQAADPTL